MIHELARILGLTDASGSWYLFWSGIFGDVTILGAVVVFVFKHNCHTDGCWRLARHQFENGVVLCRKHHPERGRTW